MDPLIAQIVISWPAILSSLFISTAGIMTRQWYLLIVGAILSIGFAWYLTNLPVIVFKITGYSLPLLHLAAMFFVLRRMRWAAGLLLLPYAAIAAYFGIGVLIQNYS
ncbi:hypothetical protein ACP3TJ_01885 [Desulforudis sp. 1088]|uniref:hypothetical protein n=1 Tax=unclassified Candidatus Desulforudis TaxID=2635950 RepID=UPI00348A6DE2